ncbi:MAG: O-succinylbenzoate synthase, partial [Propionibacteriaceae bacterium]
VQPLGGVRACLEIAERIGLPVVVSSALETSIGIRAGLALAAALPELPFACGLNTVPLLTDDLVTDPLVAVAGRLTIAALQVSDSALQRCAADADRQAFWQARLVQTAEASEVRDG